MLYQQFYIIHTDEKTYQCKKALNGTYQFEYPPSTNRYLHITENHIIAINVQN